MKQTLEVTAIAFAIAASITVAPANAQNITPAEREQALDYLDRSRDALLASVKDLSPAQWNFKPAPNRWSIADVVEHVAVLEDFFANTLARQIANAPAGKPGRDVKQIDEMILAKVPDRSQKVQAPESIRPTGRWTAQTSLEHFVAARKQSGAFLATVPNLRGHVASHPALGELDGYEWVLAIAAHTERHTKQILEVKADANFPLH